MESGLHYRQAESVTVVSVSTTTNVLIQDAKEFHLRVLRSQMQKNDLAASFASWLLPSRTGDVQLDKLVNAAAEAKGASRTFRTIAVLGFAMERPDLRQQFALSFRSGLNWLIGRSSRLEGTPTAIISDGVAFLGISLGVFYLDDSVLWQQFAPWSVDVVSDVRKSSGLDATQKGFFHAAGLLASVRSKATGISDTISPAVLCALASKGIIQCPADVAATTLSVSRQTDYRKDDWCIASVRLAVLDWLTNAAPVIDLKTMTADDVAKLLHRVQSSFLRWVWEDKPRVKKAGAVPQKWHIDNEYHVQSILWTILSPIFPDLKEEEYTASVAHLQSRADLCIPSLKLIIEVKFWYPNDKPQDLIQQIAADASLYLKPDSGFTAMIAVVWDDEARVQDHDLFRQGLKTIRGIHDVVLISRPSVMRQPKRPK
jgi:hypothetical protein